MARLATFRKGNAWPHVVAMTVLSLLTVWFYAEVLFQDRAFGFRDAGHFYYPLFEFQRQELLAGRFPMTTDRELLGYPLAADAVSSTYYPGKLILFLPGSTLSLLSWYLAIHQFLAAALMYALALRFGRSPPAALMAATAYSFGGTVLFQHCNVVYLVSAAWLPLAVMLGDNVIRRRSLWSTVGLGITLAMMVLGGDPQMAYHVGLLMGIALLLSGWNLWRRRKLVKHEDQPEDEPEGTDRKLAWYRRIWQHKPISKRLALLAMAGLFGGLLAAIQIVPTAKLSSKSFRNLRDRPRNIYEAVGDAWRGDGPSANATDPKTPRQSGKTFWESCLYTPPLHRQEGHAYQFSVPPWKYLELAGANLGGEFLPVHQRWTRLVPAGGRIWTPTLYLGLPVLLLSVIGVCHARGARSRWLRFMLVYAVLASLGVYGLGWLGKELEFAFTGDLETTRPFHSAAGGLYWLMVKLLPFYVMFRFPAKWLVIFSLIMSLVAARGLDRCRLFARHKESIPAFRIGEWVSLGLAAGLILISAGMLVSWPLLTPRMETALSDSAPDSLFGPLYVEGCLEDVWYALAHLLIVGFGFLLLVLFWRRQTLTSRSLALWLVAGITCVDLSLAHQSLLETSPHCVFLQPSVLADVPRPKGHDGPLRFVTTSQGSLYPRNWRAESSLDRMSALVEFDRTTNFSRCGLLDDVTRMEAIPTLRPAVWSLLMSEAKRRPGKKNSLRAFDPRALDLFAVDAVIVPSNKAQHLLDEGWLPGGRSAWRIWRPTVGWWDEEVELEKPVANLIDSSTPTPTPLEEKSINHVVVLVRKEAAPRKWDAEILELLELSVNRIGDEQIIRQRIRKLLNQVPVAQPES